MVQTQHNIPKSTIPSWHNLFADIVTAYNNIKSNVKKNNEFIDPITQIDTYVGSAHTHTHSGNIKFHNNLYVKLSENLIIAERNLTYLIYILIDYIFTVLFVLMYYCIILLFDKSVDIRVSLV